MKKATFTIVLGLATFLFSCTKNHVCTCNTIVVTNGVSVEAPKMDTVINEMSTKNAVELCNSKDTYVSEGNVATTKNCELK